MRSSCKAGCVIRRRASAPPVGFVVAVESPPSPLCLLIFSPPPHAGGYYALCCLLSGHGGNPFPPRYAAIPVRCLFARLRWATRRSARALVFQFRPFWIYGSVRHRYARQISPGKNAMFRCTSAAFTLSAAPSGFAMRCQLARRPGLLCDFCPSPRTFALRLPPNNPSRTCPCLRLVVILVACDKLGSPTGDFHPITSRPCWAHTRRSTRTLRDKAAQRR